MSTGISMRTTILISVALIVNLQICWAQSSNSQATLSLLPVTVEIGFESFDDLIFNGSRIDADAETVPVIRIVTPTKMIWCSVDEERRQLFEAKDERPALETSVCSFGFGIRGIAGTRLIRGDWEPLTLEAGAIVTPRFKYRQSPIGAEFVFGTLSNIRPLWTIGVGLGLNFYDLLILNGDRKLWETSDISLFLFGVATLDLVGVYDMIRGRKFGERHWGIVARIQSDLECFDRCNVVDASGLPRGGPKHKPIFLESQSLLLVVSFPF